MISVVFVVFELRRRIEDTSRSAKIRKANEIIKHRSSKARSVDSRTKDIEPSPREPEKPLV